MPALRKLVIVAETQISWKPRPGISFPENYKNQLDQYLPSPIKMVEFINYLGSECYSRNIDLEFMVVDNLEPSMDKLKLSASPNTCFWIISDGRRFHNSGPLNAWLSLLGLKYYGIDTTIQSLTDNKFLMSTVIQKHGVSIPASWLYRGAMEIASLDGVYGRTGQFFVKPNLLGSQVGIFDSSRVSTMGEALALSEEIHRELKCDALVQSYIEGDDVRVSAVETKRNGLVHECSKVTVRDVKGEIKPFSSNKAISGRLWKLDPEKKSNIKLHKLAKQIIFLLTGLGLGKDYFAIDLRGTLSGDYVFLENNVKPFVTKEAYQPLADKFNFRNIGELFIDSIIQSFKSET